MSIPNCFGRIKSIHYQHVRIGHMDSQKYSEEKSFVPQMTRKIKQMIRKEKANVQTSFETWQKTSRQSTAFKEYRTFVWMTIDHNMIIT